MLMSGKLIISDPLKQFLNAVGSVLAQKLQDSVLAWAIRNVEF